MGRRSISHPALPSLIREMVAIADRKGVTRCALARRAGLSDNVIYQWNSGAMSPGLANFEAVLNVLGFQLRIVKALSTVKDQS